MVDTLLEGSLGRIAFEALEEAGHQVAGWPFHGLGKLEDLGDDLALLAQLLHFLAVALHLLLECREHVVAIGIFLHEDIAVIDEKAPGLLPIGLLERIQQGLVVLLEQAVVVDLEGLLTLLEGVFSAAARLDDRSLLCHVADVVHVERTLVLKLLRLVMLACGREFLLLRIDLLLLAISSDPIYPDVQVLVQVGMMRLLVIAQLNAIPLRVIETRHREHC
mmetsp:Transcript_2889/g.7217  ORF Transcript_2889/g.7217 Transcript_2889/m.7217 type:complete len:220 (-) Transcript_2889:47-706(-)